MIYGAIDTSENNGLRYDGAAAAAAGVKIWWARSTIGWARLDPAYFIVKKVAEDNNIPFGTYGLNWPLNRDGRREGRYMLDHLVSGASPRPPRFVVCDAELGSKNDSVHNIVPAETVVVNILYFLETLATSGIETFLYTGGWFLTDPRLAAAFQKYAQDLRKYALILAEYPFQSTAYKLLHGGPMKPAQFDPWIAKPTLPSPPVFPRVPAPWTKDDLLGVQWSSYGKQQGICFNPAPWDRLDYSAFFRIPGTPPEPPGPTLEERVTALEQKAHTHGG